MDQLATVATVRALRRAEERCFEAVGRAAGAAQDAAATVVLNTVSRHHAWRAGQWSLLDAAGADAAAPTWVTAALADVEHGAATIPDAPGAAPLDSVQRWRVATALPLIGLYQRLADDADVAADAPLRRTAQRCLADLRLDLDGPGSDGSDAERDGLGGHPTG